MPGIAIESTPQWAQDYVKELIERSRKLGSEEPTYGRISPERNLAIKRQIQSLERAQTTGSLDIVDFSITGKSKPIHISPLYLREIAINPEFAKRIYEEATGNHNPSRDQIDVLVRRARDKFEYERQNSQKFNKILESEKLQGSFLKKIPLEEERISFPVPGKADVQGTLRDFKRYIDEPGLIESDYSRIYKEKPTRKQIEDFRNATIRGIHPYLQQEMLERARSVREIEELQKEGATIAPMNPMHERAINMLEQSFNDDTMRLAADELRESRKHSELGNISRLVTSSIERPDDAYINKYIDDYTRDIRKAMQDESEEQYVKDIAPRINMSFAQMGAFHSGARAKALKDTLLEHRQKLHRELAHLTGHARDKAMEHYEMQKRREQTAAHQLGEATRSEREGARQQAEILRQQAVTKQGLAQLNAAALGQAARAQQEQEQHQIDAERMERARQMLHPYEQLARESALLSGMPLPTQSISSSLQPAPPPPNLFTLGAGALGSLAAGLQQQKPQQGFKSGGMVRKNYADGGHAKNQGTDIEDLIREQGQADKLRLQEALNYNPTQSWLRHVGNEMLMNPQEDPLISLGRGTAASFNHRDVERERAANLYDKIQATKLSQYKVLAEYENMKDKNILKREDLMERERYHQKQNALRERMLGRSQSPGTSLSSEVQTGLVPISSPKERAEILKDKKASESILRDLDSIKKLSNEYEQYSKNLFISPRNPIMGEFASKAQGKYSLLTQNKGMRKAAVAKAALDSKLEKFKINMESKMRKGVLPEGMRQFMEKKEVFPSSTEPLDIYNKKLEDLIEETRNMYEANTESLKQGVHISPSDLKRSSKGKEEGELSEKPWYEKLGGSLVHE